MQAWKYIKGPRVLLLSKEDNFSCLPQELQTVFKGSKGLQTDIKVDEPLVGANGHEIETNLNAHGWHIWPSA